MKFLGVILSHMGGTVFSGDLRRLAVGLTLLAGLVCVAAIAVPIISQGPLQPEQPPPLPPSPLVIAAGKCPAIKPGEKLTYDIGWGFITAGHSTLEIMPISDHNGTPAWQMVMTAKSTTFMDKLYKVRDQYTAWIAPDMSRSLEYDQMQHEGSTIRDMHVVFDTEKMEARRVLNKKKDKPVKIQQGTFDPLAALYVFRLKEYRVGDTITFPVSDGKLSIMATATVIAEEKIETEAGEFDTYKVEPDTKDLAGVFKKSSGAKVFVWFSKDARHIPVKVSSKVFIGSFTAELTSITREGEDPKTGKKITVPTMPEKK